MNQQLVADRFETHRSHLQSVAYRMLGSLTEADDAVQEAWLRLHRTDLDTVDNLGGWLRIVVSRVCLDMMRTRAARHEDLVDQPPADRHPASREDPEQEALMADSVGRALLLVLNNLTPDERVAFVLHDMFAVPFEEIAPIVARSPTTAKKLASRARGKVRGIPELPNSELIRHRRIVSAFLIATRAGDLDGVVAVLAPDITRYADRAAIPASRPAEVRGAQKVAREISQFGKAARYADVALVDGLPGIVIAPQGRLTLVIAVTVKDGLIDSYHLIAEPARLSALTINALEPLPTEAAPSAVS